jgi:ribonucleotide reductase alpha subunit
VEKIRKMVTYNDALEKAKIYFNGDELAATTYLGKYALTLANGDIIEPTPDLMHRRLAKEFARIESKYSNPLSENDIFEYLDNFKYIIPQGSPMAGIGNPHQVMSISNCFVIPAPCDSYGGILFTDQQEAQIMKRRGGVGFDISTIRPKGLLTNNAAKTTDGIVMNGMECFKIFWNMHHSVGEVKIDFVKERNDQETHSEIGITEVIKIQIHLRQSILPEDSHDNTEKSKHKT